MSHTLSETCLVYQCHDGIVPQALLNPPHNLAINEPPELLIFRSQNKMTTTMSKRTQVRNERALQELVKTVPGNDRCADCAARNPGASCSPSPFYCYMLTASQVGPAGVYVAAPMICWHTPLRVHCAHRS